jgi:prepilin-type N-terminal cleavage/methylation domain-containing protein
MRSTQEKGFTLIELLVVIAIIGLLAGVITALLNPAEYIKQARDARRISDILSIQTAVTNALTTNYIQLITTSNCNTCNSIDSSALIDGTGWVRFTTVSGNGLGNYIPTLPIDPVNEGELMFSYYSDGNSFELNAKLESEKYTDYMLNDGGKDNTLYERGFSLILK